MKPSALKTLDTLVTPQEKRQKRLIELLRRPDVLTTDWFMFVPSCFNAALDIQETVRIIKDQGEKRGALQWTQGSKFSFSVGDVVYDTPRAYEKWSEALKHIRHCFHVRAATSVAPANGASQRSAGRVTFDLLIPDKSKTKLTLGSKHDMTQDEFVRLLIAGSSSQLTLSSPDTLL